MSLLPPKVTPMSVSTSNTYMKLQNFWKLGENAKLSKKQTLPISGQNLFPQWCPLIRDYTVFWSMVITSVFLVFDSFRISCCFDWWVKNVRMSLLLGWFEHTAFFLPLFHPICLTPMSSLVAPTVSYVVGTKNDPKIVSSFGLVYFSSYSSEILRDHF